jgi:putative transposase
MPHALTSNLLHCIFSTKDRADTIPDPATLGRYLGGVAREKKIPLILAGGTRNHVHVLIALPASMTLAKAMQDLKGNSSRWLGLQTTGFAWQEGYSAFSVSPPNKQAVIAYINGQERHHAKRTFESKLLSILQKAEIDYDER